MYFDIKVCYLVKQVCFLSGNKPVFSGNNLFPKDNNCYFSQNSLKPENNICYFGDNI